MRHPLRYLVARLEVPTLHSPLRHPVALPLEVLGLIPRHNRGELRWIPGQGVVEGKLTTGFSRRQEAAAAGHTTS